ncbi:type II toxin-antitoxin system RelE family toxin [Archangium gephyra]|uniref:type II toxin-antitoxin system RelE family toxin n=1 Tax=Archangium gephyra TaxID=48 RepID=UPI003B7643B3
MSLSENVTAYSIEVSSGAWKQLSHLPLETYQRVRGELDAVAARLANLGPHTLTLLKTVCLLTSLSLVVGDYVVLYDMEPEHKRVTLREVARRLPRDA